MMKTSGSSELNKVLKAVALGFASAVLVALAFATGYQTEKHASR